MGPHRVKRAHERRPPLADAEVDAQRGPAGRHDGGEDLGRVAVLEVDRLGDLGAALLVRGLYRRGEVGRRADDVVGIEVGDERRVDHGAVLVGDLAVAEQVGDVLAEPRERRECRPEQQEPDAVRAVPPDDLGLDGEGRVVDHDAPLGVVEALIVAAWVERAHERGAVDPVGGGGPVGDGVVDLGRRVAVVGCPLVLELLEELVVLVVPVLPRPAAVVGDVEEPGRDGLEAEVAPLELGEVGHVGGEDGLVEPAAHGRLVVDDAVGAARGVVQVVQADDGDLGAAEALEREDAPVPLDDLERAVGVGPDADRVALAEALDGGGDGGDLGVGVELGVAGVGHEGVDGDVVDLEGRQGRVVRASGHGPLLVAGPFHPIS